MPILPVGKISRPRRRGVTLIEMVVVVAIISIMIGITFPAVSAGLDSIRLSSASNSVASFLNAALTRAQRRQVVVELSIAPKENALAMYSTEPGFERRLEMPSGVSIQEVLPKPQQEFDGPRRFLLFPGGTAPRAGVQIGNARGSARIIRIDPVTGVPRIEAVNPQ